MQTKEEKICSFQQKGSRLQLVKIVEEDEKNYFYTVDEKTGYRTKKIKGYKVKYQVRLNRKVIDTSISEYLMRKLFATYAQNIVLQLKIY